MRLAVVILNWNAVADTIRTVQSAMNWRFEGSGRSVGVKILVVDNGSEELGIDTLETDYPEVLCIRAGDNLGFAGGNNLGISAALELDCDAILLLNNDASVDASSIAVMLSTLDSAPRIGVVGPILFDGAALLSAGGRDIARYGATHSKPHQLPTQPMDVDYVSGTVALLSRPACESVGALDEEFFFAGEMADFCLRARKQGFRCVTEPGATATHDLKRSARLRNSLHPYYVIRNRFLYIRKHYRSQRVRLQLIWIVRGVWGIARALGTGNFTRAKSLSLGLTDGVTGRFGRTTHRALFQS